MTNPFVILNFFTKNWNKWCVCSSIMRVIPFYCDYFSSQPLDLSILHLFGPGFFFKTASGENNRAFKSLQESSLAHYIKKGSTIMIPACIGWPYNVLASTDFFSFSLRNSSNLRFSLSRTCSSCFTRFSSFSMARSIFEISLVFTVRDNCWSEREHVTKQLLLMSRLISSMISQICA